MYIKKLLEIANFSLFTQFFNDFLKNEGSLITAYGLEYFPKKNNRRATFIREIRVVFVKSHKDFKRKGVCMFSKWFVKMLSKSSIINSSETALNDNYLNWPSYLFQRGKSNFIFKLQLNQFKCKLRLDKFL